MSQRKDRHPVSSRDRIMCVEYSELYLSSCMLFKLLTFNIRSKA